MAFSRNQRIAFLVVSLFLNIPYALGFVIGRARARALFGDGVVNCHIQIRRHAQTRTDEDVPNENDSSSPSQAEIEPPISSFESMVRNLTGNPSYRFGDLTKGAVSTTTHAFVDVLAKKTRLVDQDYHFGVSNVASGYTNTMSTLFLNPHHLYRTLQKEPFRPFPSQSLLHYPAPSSP